MSSSPIKALPVANGQTTRQRARKACIACRKRKRKCDVQLPCSMCKVYSYKCEYQKDDGPLAGLIDTTPKPVPNDIAMGQAADNSAGSNWQHVPGQGAAIVNQRADMSWANRSPEGLTNSTKRKRNEMDVSPSALNHGMLDPFKSRFVGQNSAIAFARNLGVELQSQNPPALHSFGWNCGIRPEENVETHEKLFTIISKTDLIQYSAVYFSVVHPLFGVLDEDSFTQRCGNYWNSPNEDVVFGAIICGIVALGSFFCMSRGHPAELKIVQYAKAVLEDPLLTRAPSIDLVAAWILRTLYLRLTTRPNNSWLASCTTLHLAEAIGLHHETTSVLLLDSGNATDLCDTKKTRRIFWLAWFFNAMISYEYGRSAVTLSSITCQPITAEEGDFTTELLGMASLVPSSNTLLASPTQQSEYLKWIDDLFAMPDSHRFVTLSKADLCFCFYRRLRIFKQPLPKEAIAKIILIGNNAVSAALHFVQQNLPWFNILGDAFQYTCVLLAIDTAESLAEVSHTIEVFEQIVQILGTHLAIEALKTAKRLVADSMRKKRRELALLESVDGQIVNSTSLGDYEEGLDIDWDQLFEMPYSYTTPWEADGGGQ